MLEGRPVPRFIGCGRKSLFSDLHPQFAPWARWLYEVAEYNRLSPRVTSTTRSMAEQQRLRARYEAGESHLPASRPGCSQHNYGLAFDLVSENNEGLGRIWESVGGRWGGTFANYDPVHFGVNWFPCS